MSLITRCPACTTTFKVVPDQLRISEGWVRCGQCAHIFDASVHLQDDAAVVGTPSAAAPGGAAPVAGASPAAPPVPPPPPPPPP
ncbi:MAG: hypothetical protein CVU30_07875, partial [Betaproteobacteria bacterium HGW-Betaproteobacteria-3]